MIIGLGKWGETLWAYETNDGGNCDGLTDCSSDKCPMKQRGKNKKCTKVQSHFENIQLSSSDECIYLDSSNVIKSDSCSSQHIWACKVRCANGKMIKINSVMVNYTYFFQIHPSMTRQRRRPHQLQPLQQQQQQQPQPQLLPLFWIVIQLQHWRPHMIAPLLMLHKLTIRVTQSGQFK